MFSLRVYKIYCKINRLQRIAGSIIVEDQTGFQKSRSTVNDIFVLKQILEKCDFDQLTNF